MQGARWHSINNPVRTSPFPLRLKSEGAILVAKRRATLTYCALRGALTARGFPSRELNGVSLHGDAFLDCSPQGPFHGDRFRGGLSEGDSVEAHAECL